MKTNTKDPKIRMSEKKRPHNWMNSYGIYIYIVKGISDQLN